MSTEQATEVEALAAALAERLPVSDTRSRSEGGVEVDLAVHFGTRAGLIDHIVDIVQLTRVGDEERLRADQQERFKWRANERADNCEAALLEARSRIVVMRGALDELRLIEPNEPDHPGPYYDGWHAALDAVDAVFALAPQPPSPAACPTCGATDAHTYIGGEDYPDHRWQPPSPASQGEER